MIYQSLPVLYFTLLVSFTHSYSGQDGCKLPDGWRGDWFESGVPGTISIISNSSESSIQHKGRCVKKIRHSNSQFIFQSKSEGNCFRCVSIHQKHENVLQYKESRCLMEYHSRNFHELCWTISVDQPLQTMFRVNGNGVSCPISGTFSFSYSRGHGLCNYPLSSLHQCADKSQLVLSYQACVDIKGSQSHTEHAQCVGDWKEGSTYYFAAIINSSHVSRFSREDSFRCFVYKQIHNGYQMSQSADAKCNLYTATEGYRTMTLNQLKQDDRSCQFPSWFISHHRRYHSLNSDSTISVNQAGNVINIQSEDRKADAADDGMEDTRLECISEKFVHNKTARFTVQSVQSCQQASFHCVQLWWRSNDVMEIKIGKAAPNNEDACLEHHFFDDSVPVQTITAAHLHSYTCSLTGNFLLRSQITRPESLVDDDDDDDDEMIGADDCNTLTAGCDNTNKLIIKNSCDKLNTEFTCHDSWSEDDFRVKRQFTIVSYKTRESRSVRRCVVKRKDLSDDDVELSLHSDCSLQSHKSWSVTAANFGDCAPTALATANSCEQLLAGTLFLLTTLVLNVVKLKLFSLNV